MYHFYADSHTNSVSLEEYIMIGIPTKAKGKKVSQGAFENLPHRSLSSKTVRVQTFQSCSLFFLTSPGNLVAVWPRDTSAICFYFTCSEKINQVVPANQNNLLTSFHKRVQSHFVKSRANHN